MGRCPQTDPARILFPADPAEPVTLGVAGSADAGILFPAVTAEIPVSMGPAGMLLATDIAEFNTVGVVDVAVAGEVLPAFPDVFHRPELVAMVGVGEVGTGEGIPVDCDDYEYKDPRNEFETVDGITVVIFMTRIVRTPVILLTKIGWNGVILTLRMVIVGFFRMTGRPGCLLLSVPL